MYNSTDLQPCQPVLSSVLAPEHTALEHRTAEWYQPNLYFIHVAGSGVACNLLPTSRPHTDAQDTLLWKGKKCLARTQAQHPQLLLLLLLGPT